MRGKIGDKERLGHILDAIAEIEAYTANIELKDFLANGDYWGYTKIKSGSFESQQGNSLSFSERRN